MLSRHSPSKIHWKIFVWFVDMPTTDFTAAEQENICDLCGTTVALTGLNKQDEKKDKR